ncbi:hypothetical protein SO802_031696 [Lithocarpus litseifolius]|uniref:Uncharacterized protein n=1 Tax=Lithocarpus litseifolius TaxID=425828 RepID=A0AAW2BRU2_9ROSI
MPHDLAYYRWYRLVTRKYVDHNSAKLDIMIESHLALLEMLPVGSREYNYVRRVVNRQSRIQQCVVVQGDYVGSFRKMSSTAGIGMAKNEEGLTLVLVNGGSRANKMVGIWLFGSAAWVFNRFSWAMGKKVDAIDHHESEVEKLSKEGHAYNTFPKMGDTWIPEDVLDMKPLIRNFFENTSTVQVYGNDGWYFFESDSLKVLLDAFLEKQKNGDQGEDLDLAIYMGFFNQAWKEGMTKDEAEQLVVKAVSLAIARDGASGGVVRTVIINSEGVTRNFYPDDKLPLQHEEHITRSWTY